MPKVKTRKAVSKRFKLTKSGQLKRSSCKKRHLLTCKTRKKKRKLKDEKLVKPADLKNMKTMMPYA